MFAHSLLDAAVDEYYTVSAMLCTDDWADLVDENTVTLREARTAPFEELLRKAVSLHLKALRKKSILNRIKVLQGVCKPGSGPILDGYTFDGARVEQFDKLRHSIVHAGAFELADQDVTADLEFIERTSISLC